MMRLALGRLEYICNKFTAENLLGFRSHSRVDPETEISQCMSNSQNRGYCRDCQVLFLAILHCFNDISAILADV